MAEFLIDEKTEQGFIRCEHSEMLRGLLAHCWHSIGSSLSVLASGEARPRLSAIEDVTATYTTSRVALNTLFDHIGGCPPEVAAYPQNKAPLDICRAFRDQLEADDLNVDQPESENDPRVLFFIEMTIAWVELLWSSMEQMNGRKARTRARQFSKRLDDLKAKHGRHTRH